MTPPSVGAFGTAGAFGTDGAADGSFGAHGFGASGALGTSGAFGTPGAFGALGALGNGAFGASGAFGTPGAAGAFGTQGVSTPGCGTGGVSAAIALGTQNAPISTTAPSIVGILRTVIPPLLSIRERHYLNTRISRLDRKTFRYSRNERKMISR
jgi:hypothetical protein